MGKINSISDFLKFSKSSQEVSLIIANDNAEQEQFSNELVKDGFKEAESISELLNAIETSSKTYFLVGEYLPKDFYDFLLQYPTGQIDIFDKKTMKSEIAIPLYRDVSIVFIITKSNLSQVQRGEFDLLSHVGMAYQN